MRRPVSVTDPVRTARYRRPVPAASSPPRPDLAICRNSGRRFNTAPKRIQNGAGAQYQADFQNLGDHRGCQHAAAQADVANLHWLSLAEWPLHTYGIDAASLSSDPAGMPMVADVMRSICVFPAGFPHSLQGLGPDGADFISPSTRATHGVQYASGYGFYCSYAAG